MQVQSSSRTGRISCSAPRFGQDQKTESSLSPLPFRARYSCLSCCRSRFCRLGGITKKGDMGNRKIARAVILKDRCEDSGVCVKLYPEMFEIDRETEQARTKLTEGWDDARLLQAARRCPLKAIVLIDDKSREIDLKKGLE